MKENNYSKKNEEIDFNDCEEMFEEGFSDIEISKEIGINKKYIKKLREEYENDY